MIIIVIHFIMCFVESLFKLSILFLKISEEKFEGIYSISIDFKNICLMFLLLNFIFLYIVQIISYHLKIDNG